MAVNLASKYSSKVDERFTKKSFTESLVNQNYDWQGVNAVTVYGVETAPMNDYSMTGNARYGTSNELGNTTQTMTLTRDRAFTFTIDRKNYQDTQMVMEAGKALARQLDEVVTPEIDIYRLATMSAAAVAAGGKSAVEVIDATNAYKALLHANEYMSDYKVPIGGRVAVVTNQFYSNIKLDNSFIKASETGQKMLINGQVGEVDGTKIVAVPASYLPANTDFILVHPIATVAPKKLEDYKTHDNPVGVNGWVIEGRLRYDTFVLNNKNRALYVHKNA